MYQKILVPIDSSATSFRALDEACNLGRALDITVHAVHAVHVVDLTQVGLAGMGAADNLALRQSVSASSSAILAQAEEVVAQRGVAFEGKVLETNGEKIADVLMREAEASQCQLIIMGTQGLTGMKRLLLGSVAEGVVRQSVIPVMLVRQLEQA